MVKLFISDLHLEEAQPAITDIFLKFLQTETKKADALYILGDFFEVWIGDDDHSPFHQTIINALKSAANSGLSIYFMHGNRDFLIGKKFARESGCQLLPEAHVVNLNGAPTLLMHGDSLCTQDVRYLKFRKKSRNFFVQKLFLWKKLEKRRAIAQRYRTLSQAHTRNTAENIMDVTQTEVERIMQQHGVQQLIHGHTHRQAVHHFLLNNQPMTRTVLGAWHTQGNALVCRPGQENEFLIID